jgi:hypothetical protein
MGARLSNILDCWIVPILTKVLTGNLVTGIRDCALFSYFYFIIKIIALFKAQSGAYLWNTLLYTTFPTPCPVPVI